MKRKKASSLQRRLKSWHITKLHIYIVALLLFAVAVSTSVYYRYETVKLRTSYGTKIWTAGEIVQDSRFAFSFNSAARDNLQIPGFWELEPGQTYLLVDVSFKNNTTKDYQLSPILSMSIQAPTGLRYAVTSAPGIQNSLGGPVHPGKTAKGEVGFTVPTDFTHGRFTFSPRLPGTADIAVDFTL